MVCARNKMAPTTRRNASKKRRNSNTKIGIDSEERRLEMPSDEKESDISSSSEDEMSDADSDLEKLATDSASQILSRIGTQQKDTAQQARQHSKKKSKQKVAGRSNTSSKTQKTEEEEEEDEQSDEHEVQFVIDTKPFSRKTASTSDFLDEIDGMECEEDSDSEESDRESNYDNDKLVTNTGNHVQLSQRPSQQKKGILSLRAQISDEITKITERKDDYGMELASELDPGTDFGGSYVSYDLAGSSSSSRQTDSLEKILQKSGQDKLIQKSVITPDFEKKHDLPKQSLNQQKKLRKQFRESKTGKGWYDMPGQEMTDELRNSLRILRMRSVLDPKRFYKHNDSKVLPKFVQVGTVVDTPIDFYHGRVPNKQRKQNVVDELLADAEMRRYNKRKYLELQDRARGRFKGKFKGKKLQKFKKGTSS